MVQQRFAEQVIKVIKDDPSVIGLAIGGSWLTNEIDEYSDLDLVLVTKEKVADDRNKMIAYAERFGKLLNNFTGEHVGESRLLICLYDDPLLHVDIKFLTLPELHPRIENPVIVYDTDDQLKKAFESSIPQFPYPDYQWIEDRFWTWIHYTLLKIGRGEYIEAIDCFSLLRGIILGPLLLIKQGQLPRGVRKLEKQLDKKDFNQLLLTIPAYDRDSLFRSLEATIAIYTDLRTALYPSDVQLRKATEARVLEYLQQVRSKNR